MIECGSLALPPQGCLQYHTGIAGQVRSFNFNSNSYQHLSNQNYQACIRREAEEVKPEQENFDDITLFDMTKDESSISLQQAPNMSNSNFDDLDDDFDKL